MPLLLMPGTHAMPRNFPIDSIFVIELGLNFGIHIYACVIVLIFTLGCYPFL